MAVQGGSNAGKISKPNGIRGEVNIILIPSVAKYIDTGNPLFIDLDGQRVPFFIESAELVAADQAIVKFEFINSIEEAKKVAGCQLYLDPSLNPETSGQADELGSVVGYHVVDLQLGPLGLLVEYVPGEKNPVWIIDYSGKELLVPATSDFIQNIDRRKRLLHLDLPEGITEL